MSAIACNPYASDFAVNCGGMLLPAGPPPLNPYHPDGLHDLPALTPAVFQAFGLPNETAEAAPVTRYEDELAAAPVVATMPGALLMTSEWADVAPVPEPGAAVLLSVALLAALWRARR